MPIKEKGPGSSEVRSGVKKITGTIVTQALVLGLSVITGFILPGKMGPEMYGYFQIYIFYLAYINLFGLGWGDGIALYYGGYDYKELPFDRLRSAMRFFLVYLIVVTGILFAASSLISGEQYRNVYQMLAVNVPLVCLQCAILSVFLSVNRTAVYNVVNLSAKVLTIAFYLALIVAGITTSEYMIYSDTAARVIITIACIVLARKFISGKTSIKPGISEFAEKSKAGINITLAIIASTFIPVAGRVIIQLNESIAVYGIYSFAMTLLTVVIVFTNAAGTVFFPLLKRLPEDKLPVYYGKFSFICDTLVYTALLAYIPLFIIIEKLMPEYVTVLAYMHILLVMCVPLGKMQLLVTPYYKAARLERPFFAVNIVGVIAMIGATAAVYSIFMSVVSVAICSAIVLTIWTVMTERYMIKKIGSAFDKTSLFIQSIMMAGFVIAGSFGNLYIFAAIYGFILAVYLTFFRKKGMEIIKLFKDTPAA